MYNWKNLFTKAVLEKSKTYKSNICDIKHTTSSISATVVGNRKFKVELVTEHGELFDMMCSCSGKSNCVHEAVFLRFIDEFPEIMEDHELYYKKGESVLNADCEDMLKQISSTKLNSFIKKELKHNSQFRYNFIKHFDNTSLIDAKLYEKTLKSIFANSKAPEFKYDGYYDVNKFSRPLKKFLRVDIKTLIDAKEYSLAAKLLNDIMDRLADEIYLEERKFYDIIYYYIEYAEILSDKNISKKERELLKSNVDFFAFFGFY